MSFVFLYRAIEIVACSICCKTKLIRRILSQNEPIQKNEMFHELNQSYIIQNINKWDKPGSQ